MTRPVICLARLAAFAPAQETFVVGPGEQFSRLNSAIE